MTWKSKPKALNGIQWEVADPLTSSYGAPSDLL